MSLLKHLAVFALGFAVFWIGGRMPRSQPEPEPEPEPTPSAAATEAAAQHGSRRTISVDQHKVASVDYQEAWEELQQLDPRSAGYRQIRQRLIEDWLQEDFPGALTVLMMNFDSAILAKELVTPELVDANEDWIIASLQDRRFSLHGRFLLDLLVTKRPNAPVESKWKYVDLLDPKRQRYVFYSAFTDPDTRKQWLKKVEELSRPSLRARARQQYIAQRLSSRWTGRGEPIEDLIASVREMENPETQAHMAKAIMDQQWSERQQNREKTIALLDVMEGDMYDAALGTALAKLPDHHPTDDLLKHLDAYLDGGHFEAFNRIDNEFLRGWTFDDDHVRDWVWSLPERSESARMVRGTVAWKFSQNPAAAREWLAEKDAGWQKNQAMVELARVATEPDHANWVLEEITDPALRTEAEGHLQER